MTNLSLAEKVEGLSCPCRETDVLIIQRLYSDIGPHQPHCAGDPPIFWNDPYYKRPCPRLTESLDAVVALIEKELPGWVWDVTSTGLCWVMSPDSETHINASAATPALALLAAFLRAKGEQNG